MHDIFKCPAFSKSEIYLRAISKKIAASELVHLQAPAEINSIIALSFIESALIEKKINYKRRITAPNSHLPKDEVTEYRPPKIGLSLVIDLTRDTEEFSDIEESNLIQIYNRSVEFELGSSGKKVVSVLDVVSQCASIAYTIDDSPRLRKLRYLLGTGQWLRESMDTTYDPIHSLIRDHLKSEGTIDVVPLPESHEEGDLLLKNIPTRMIGRLRKKWEDMDYNDRAMALSEIALLAIAESDISTSRLEELIWHRILHPSLDYDLATTLDKVQLSWPKGSSEARLFASELIDSLITDAKFKLSK